MMVDNSHQIRLDVEASVTLQVMSTEEPLFAKISGAPSILVTGTRIELLFCAGESIEILAVLPITVR